MADVGNVVFDRSSPRLAKISLFLFVVVLAILAFGIWSSHARDLGQWENADPAIRDWYRTLRQPDAPPRLCCDLSDAYWADSYDIAPDGRYIAIVTDDRQDEPLGRPHVPVGTRIVIPKNKIKFDQGNPTGHGLVFLGNKPWLGSIDGVYCYLPPGGI